MKKADHKKDKRGRPDWPKESKSPKPSRPLKPTKWDTQEEPSGAESIYFRKA